MISGIPGSPVTIESSWFAYYQGPPTNVSGLTLTITDPAGNVEQTASGLPNPQTGLYAYTWQVPSTAAVGAHLARWSGTVGGNPVTSTEIIAVGVTETLLEGDFFQYAGGPAVDVTGLTLVVTDPTGAVVLAENASNISHAATGVYYYLWTPTEPETAGVYTVTWAGTYSGNPVTASETITIVSDVDNTWCTIADVATITGATVTGATLAQAGSMIDIACGRSWATDGTRVGSRDAYWLKLACAYQSAWLNSQIDVFSRIDALDIAEGRMRTQLRDTAFFLSVSARKALKRVSWLKTRSIHIQSPFQDGLGASGLNPMSSATDALGPWTPIEGW